MCQGPPASGTALAHSTLFAGSEITHLTPRRLPRHLAAFGWDDPMRSIGMLAVVTGTLALASACGGDGSTPPTENTAPVASFAVPTCTINLPCDFISTSTDDAAVTAWSWDFDGDGNPD